MNAPKVRNFTQRESKSETKERKYFDYSLLLIVIFLVCFGLIMLYSTSAYNATLKFNNPTFYLKQQIKATLIGIVGMAVIARIDYRIWAKLSPLAYIGAIGLSTLVLFIGDEYNGSKRWLSIGPLSFQPAEFAKIAIIIFVAYLISKAPKSISKFSTMVKIILIVAPIVGLVAVNNLSSAIIILGIAVIMIFVSSPKYAQFMALGLIGVVGMAGFLLFASYRVERLKVWLSPEDYDKGFQTLQGLYAIGSGGLFGKGLGESMQKLGFVPEAQNDMIFSIICEELGLFGAICVIILFVLLIWRFMIISTNASDLFGSLIVVGIMGHIAIQVILNIAVVTNSIPNTGVTLPFISYGGTSICFLLAEMGLALSVSRGIRFD